MKRFIVLLLPFLSLVSYTKAQTFKAGILAGVAITDIAGMDQVDADNDFYKFGLTAGGFVNTKIGPSSSLEMEITYTQKGSQQPPDSTNNNNYYTLALNYIDVTLVWKKQLHININKKPTDKLGFEAGITLGSLISYSYTAKSNPFDLTGQLNTIDASAVIGLTYSFSPKFFFSGTYSNSFIPALKHDAFPSGSYGLYYQAWNNGANLAFQLTFGYIFNGGSEGAEDNSSAPAPPPAPTGGN